MTRSMGKIFTGTAGKLSLVRFIISRFAAFYVYHLAFYDKSTSLRVSLYSRKWDWCYIFSKKKQNYKDLFASHFEDRETKIARFKYITWACVYLDDPLKD